MGLLSTVQWSGRVFSGGWTEGGGGAYDSVEPATGRLWARLALRP